MAFDLERITNKYQNQTVLAISPRIVNQHTAAKMAREEFLKLEPYRHQLIPNIISFGSTKKCKDIQ